VNAAVLATLLSLVLVDDSSSSELQVGPLGIARSTTER